MPVRTELIWDGKYDANGKRVAPLRVPLPFQTVETINETAQDRQRNLFQAAAQEQPWRNRLIWGDKKYVLPSLLPEFAGKVHLIYIDPPFDTGADFSFTATVPEHEDDDDSLAFTKEPSIIEQKAYRDTWGRGLDSYLQWFYETVVMLHELLADNGSIYVHLDYHVGHYCKIIIDEIFGTDSFINAITWKRSDAHSDVGQGAKHLGQICDSIFFYAKNREDFAINMQYTPLPQSTADRWYRHVEESTGRRYNKADMTGPGGARKGNPVFEWNGITRAWRFGKAKMEQLEKEGRIVYSSSGMPYLKRYLDESKGVPLQDLWDDIRMVRGIHQAERIGYATQKPEALLDRIIRASSNEFDLILDCFVGSGTTAAVAEKLNRRWIACDLGRFAIHTTRKRLLSIPDVRPFVVQNLGKYERQLWQTGQFGETRGADAPRSGGGAQGADAPRSGGGAQGADAPRSGGGAQGADAPRSEELARRHRAYVDFILQLYHATPISGRTWLHGVKSGRMVHVGGVDGPVTAGDVTQIAAEFKKAMGSGKDAPTSNGLDVLGWDFAFEINEVARQQAEAANIHMRFKRIPKDVMDKRAVDQGDIHFFELAALAVERKIKGRDVTLTLTDFVIPPDDVPEEVRAAVKHWSQWIDYWAVDWDNKGDTFHNQWQTFRTRKDNKLELSANHKYEEAGKYRIVVKVIDLLGNDTTKTLTVQVK
jgi:adenine-specific DNA-methyltransferase